jgi:hypothetical protein
MVPSEQDWAQWWHDMHGRGRRHFLLRGFIFEGAVAGLVVAVFAAIAQRGLGHADDQPLSWAFLAFVVCVAWGLVNSWFQWHANERRYHELDSNGS